MKQIVVFSVALVVFTVLQLIGHKTFVRQFGGKVYESAQYGWPFAVLTTDTGSWTRMWSEFDSRPTTIYTLSGQQMTRYELTLESAVANLILCVYVSLQAVTFFLQMSRKRFITTLAELIGITLSIAVLASLFQSRDDLYLWSRNTIPLDLHWLAKGNGFAAWASDIVACATVVLLVMIFVDYTFFCATVFNKAINQHNKQQL